MSREVFRIEDADDAWKAAHEIQTDLSGETVVSPSSRSLRYVRKRANAIAAWASAELKARGE